MKHIELIEEELVKIQQNYLELLLNIRDELTRPSLNQVYDSIRIFWDANSRFINFCLRKYFAECETSVFTTARKINLETNEHHPFLLLNKHRIWDDPIINYLYAIRNLEKSDFTSQMKTVTMELIDDNIRILEEYQLKIIIIPISHFLKTPDESYRNLDRVFYSLFENPYKNAKDYFSANNSINDIALNLSRNSSRRTLLSSSDGTEGVIKNFESYISKNTLPSILKSDAEKFRFIVMGNLISSFRCLNIIYVYRFVPYIRNKIIMLYLLDLVNFVPDTEMINFKLIINKTILYFFFHNQYHIDQASEKGFDEIHSKFCEIGIEDSMLKELASINENFTDLKPVEIVKVIDEHIKLFC